MTTLFTVTYPKDGDVLSKYDGVETEHELTITVRGTAPEGTPVRVNGIAARRSNHEAFACDVPLSHNRNSIRVECGEDSRELLVWWDKASHKRFRFSLDDNILFLKDLAANPDAYRSLFDHWYMAFWREMHEEFGAKIHCNIYYQTDGFDLTEMPYRWKDEWRENASWFNLSFHALQDQPPRTYRNAQYAQIAHDYDLVCSQIRRFAGSEVISATTTVHWAECPKNALKALRDRGIAYLIGLFETHNGQCTTGYYFTPEQCDYCRARSAWYDRELGILFVDCSLVVNTVEVDQIGPLLDARAASPHSRDRIELLIHEQYFREDVPQYYQPTVKEKVRTALRWVTERGYEPVFWSDGFLGSPE
ncbi:MAG: hypothetical protein QG656_1921 [Candidatus Hydrogenedentes bacterium]|nr:hypothetical protein [Candidatus Hydrogenedentota bacterium]